MKLIDIQNMRQAAENTKTQFDDLSHRLGPIYEPERAVVRVLIKFLDNLEHVQKKQDHADRMKSY